MKSHCSASHADCCSVHQAETFLGHHSERSETSKLDGLVCADDLALAILHLAVEENVVVSFQSTSDVGKWRKISRCRDGTTEGDDGHKVVVEQSSDVLDNHESDGRVATKEGVDSGQHGTTYDRSGQVVTLEAKGALIEVIAGLALIRRQKHARVLVLDEGSLHANEVTATGVCAATVAGVDTCLIVSMPIA